MSIGTFGSIAFEVAEKKIRTFDDFKRTSSEKYEEHAVIAAKPLLEWIAPGLDVITFQMVFSASLGLNPYKEAEAVREIKKKHEYHALMLGSKTLGNFIIDSLSEAWRHIDNHGSPTHIAMDISMKEYIESTTGSGATSSRGSVVSTANVSKVTSAVQSAATKAGLAKSSLAGIAQTVLAATRDKQAAINALGGLVGNVSGLQSVATMVAAAQNKDYAGAISSIMGGSAESYKTLGLNVPDLVAKAKTDPGGAIVDILSGMSGGGESKYTAAKEIYGTIAAGPIMQVAQKSDKIQQILDGTVIS